MAEIDLSMFIDTYVSVGDILSEIKDEDLLPEVFDRWDSIKFNLISGLTKKEFNDLLKLINDRLAGNENSSNE